MEDKITEKLMEYVEETMKAINDDANKVDTTKIPFKFATERELDAIDRQADFLVGYTIYPDIAEKVHALSPHSFENTIVCLLDQYCWKRGISKKDLIEWCDHIKQRMIDEVPEHRSTYEATLKELIRSM